ncbi:MAG: ADP-ribosylglycohydrolase family protein, partial [Rhodospirillaceae bacterium]|nr:ADP-ribosylglycohydrolase family protein [Rhodospirillaceae bacterium]
MNKNIDCETSKVILNFYFPLILIAIQLTPLSINAETENNSDFINISRSEYLNKLQGFWLGQNIANWTGLITEMDKVGTPQTLP